MFCGQCGSPVNGNSVCPNCGHSNSVQVSKSDKSEYSKSLKNQIIIGASISCSIIMILITCLILSSRDSSVYFSDDNNVNDPDLEKVDVENKKPTSQLGVTSIEYDNTYYINVPTTEYEVLSLVKKDSNEQKDSCSNEIIEIENRIITNYQIEAVNLCEMDKEFALEVEKVIKYIYDKYPTARGYLTHISLGNISSNSTIAFFQWFTQFTTSSEDSLIGYKSRIILNSSFYLNENKFNSSVEYSTLSGHFPKNATIYSPLAHEFAHYLSFIATNNYYKTEPKIIYPNFIFV